MGLNASRDVTYVTILNGKIAKPCLKDADKAEKHVRNDGTEKYYQYFGSIDGVLNKISWQDPPSDKPTWSPTWQIWITDTHERKQYCLNLPFGSGYARAFFCALPHMELGKRIELVPRAKEVIVDGKFKEQRTLFIMQASEESDEMKALKWYYTKDDPKNLPPLERIKIKGKPDTYNDYEQNEFFKKLADKVNTRLDNMELNELANLHKRMDEEREMQDNPPVVEPSKNKDEDDDLPF